MKVFILKDDGTFDFEYEVPKGLGDEYLMPAIAYIEIPPPSVKLNEVAVVVNGKWVIKSDFRGTVYWLPDGKRHEVLSIDETIPDEASFDPPQSQLSKAELLNSITVTTQSGKTFDGNETARTDMLSALQAGELLGETQTNWKLADNTVALVTRDELLEALSLAMQEKGRIVGAI